MKPIQYTTRQIFIAYSLLIGLFLQSCGNNYSLEPQTSNKKSTQQPLTHSLVEELGSEYQLPQNRLAHTTLDDLGITSAQDLLQEEEQQALQPIQNTANPITSRPFMGRPSDTSPSNTCGIPKQTPHTSKGLGNFFTTTSVSEQQALSRRQAISKQEKRETEDNYPIQQELSTQVVQTKPWQTVTFYQKAGKWKARIDEQYGSLRKSQVLPVYFEGSSLPTHLQPSLVHIAESNGTDGKQSCVYVGSLGLPGGMLGMFQNHTNNKDLIAFFGNPGSGKSALLNSIFQQLIFKSGLHATGLTQSHQSFAFENRIYLDTPGLADHSRQQEAAKEIEEALKKDGSYKIIFVVTLEAARIKPQDIATVNVICEAIDKPFEYGLLINKVTTKAMEKVAASMEVYLKSFTKPPTALYSKTFANFE